MYVLEQSALSFKKITYIVVSKHQLQTLNEMMTNGNIFIFCRILFLTLQSVK